MDDSSAPEKLSYEGEVFLQVWVAKDGVTRRCGIELRRVGLVGHWPDTEVRVVWARSAQEAREYRERVWAPDGTTQRPPYGLVTDVLRTIENEADGLAG